jgi:hypothetical protein
MSADRNQPGTVARHPAWLLALAGLIAWQGWMTLGLFGPDRPWQRLRDDEPVLSGRHPLHLYHGWLGAGSLCDRGSLSCFDPAFHAGYPKTPVFDGGSRPAELALALAGAGYSPAAYKVALAVYCLLIPLLHYLAGRGIGLGRCVAVLATGLGQLVWWGGAGRAALEAGDLDLLLAAALALAQAGMLVRYHVRPGPLSLTAVVLTGLAGWFAHPLFMALLLPAFLVYYLGAGTRHRLGWHAPLLAGLAVAVAANAFWLIDWVGYWWIRVPAGADLPRLTPPALWDAPLWGASLDRALAVAMLGLGVIGAVLMHLHGRRLAARLLALAVIGLTAVALASVRSATLARLGAGQLLPPALLFAALPAAVALTRLLGGLHAWGGSIACPAVVLLGVPALVWLTAPAEARPWAERLARPEPLLVGLGEQRLALVEAVREQTNNKARILWEDRPAGRGQPRWTALLPVLTGRAFVGGLDAEAGIEHATTGLANRRLAGRPLHEVNDAELDDYCRRYNIGWVVCWSAEARERFARWRPAGAPQPLPPADGEPGHLFCLNRRPSYALVGEVRWRAADARKILLADAAPRPVAGEKEGQVVLSLHYQAGMRVSPARVRLEQAVDSHDTIPFVRLRMTEPVGRIMITWEGR